MLFNQLQDHFKKTLLAKHKQLYPHWTSDSIVAAVEISYKGVYMGLDIKYFSLFPYFEYFEYQYLNFDIAS